MQVKFVREKNLVSKFFENIDMDTGLVVYGVDATMRTILAGGVETIVVWEGLSHNRVAMVNKETGEKFIKYIKEDEMTNPKHYSDPRTEAELEVDHSQTMNLVEWLTENFKDFGSSLQLITNKSAEGF
jgi:peptide chain release factor subunit 1